MGRCVWGAVGLALIAGCHVAWASDPYRSQLVPIKLAVNKQLGGKLVYSIPVHFTSTTLQAVLDTGSQPLLVLKGRLSARDGRPTGASSNVTYGNEREYIYDIEKGPVRIGQDWRPIDFGSVTKAECLVQGCTIQGETASTALFAGLYPAIVGARITTGSSAPVAFRQYGVHRFVITAPRLGEGDGYLQLDPNAALTHNFVPVTNDPSSAGNVRGCLRNRASGAYYCGAVMLDTGHTGISVTPAAGNAQSVWSAGQPAQFEFTGADGSDVAGVDFTVAADAPTVVKIETPGTATETVIMIGQLPYIGLDILTDFDAGGYAVAPRPRAKDGVTGHVP